MLATLFMQLFKESHKKIHIANPKVLIWTGQLSSRSPAHHQLHTQLISWNFCFSLHCADNIQCKRVLLKALKISHCEKVMWEGTCASCLYVKPRASQQELPHVGGLPESLGSHSTRESCRSETGESTIPLKITHLNEYLQAYQTIYRWHCWGMRKQKPCTNHLMTLVCLETTLTEVPEN